MTFDKDCTMPEMPSSSHFPGETSFIAQYIPSLARSGVILNPTFPVPEAERDAQMLRPYSVPLACHKPDPLEHGSGHLNEGSLEEEFEEETLDAEDTMINFNFGAKGDLFMYNDPTRHKEGIMMGPVPVEDDSVREGLNSPLLRKLEQLKALQQQKQDELKQQQMEQLQKLMEEQKMLLNLVSRQQGFGELDQENQPSDPSSPGSTSNLTSPVGHHVPASYEYERCDLDSITSYLKNGLDTAFAEEHRCDASPEETFQSEDENGDFTDEDPTLLQDDPTCLIQLPEENCADAVYAEERPIVSELKEQKTSFEDFVEEQMRLEEQRLRQNTQQVSTKPADKPFTKRPFLRKGEGLARFNANPKLKEDNPPLPTIASEANNGDKAEKLQIQRKTVNVEHASESSSGPFKRLNQIVRGKAEQTPKTSVLKTHNPKNTPSSGMQANQRKVQSQNGKNPIRRDKINALKANKENVEIPPAADANHDIQRTATKIDAESPANTCQEELSFEVSFQKRKMVWEKEKQKESYELDEFLLLEQAAEDISFSSNSSFVHKLLDPNYQIDHSHSRLSSTPVKQQQGKVGLRDDHVQKIDPSKGKDNVAAELKKDPVPRKQKDEILKSAIEEHKRSRSTEQTTGDYKCFRSAESKNPVRAKIEDSGIVTSSRESDPQSESTVLSRGQKKDPKSRDFDLDLPNGESSDGDESTLLESKSDPTSSDDDSSLSSSNTSQIEFDDEKTWTDLDLENQQEFCDNKVSGKEFIPSAYTTRSPTYVPDKTIKRKVASKKGDELLKTDVRVGHQSPPPTSDLMIKLFPSLKPKQKPDCQLAREAAPVQEDPGDVVRSRLLREKLIELENEIEKFKMENASLSRLREDKEKTLESLRKEVAEFEQYKTKELARIEETKKEEMRKLQKERKVFEKYANAARAIPDKKEREEIQALKQQVKDSQEELKRKEAKWSNTHVRLRNQIETLLKENGELREEIKFMEKVRVDSWKKAEAAESKKTTDGGNNRRPSDSIRPPKCTEKSKSPLSASEQEKSTKPISRSQSPDKGKATKPYRSAAVCNVVNPENMKTPEAILPLKQKIQTPLLQGNEDEEVQGEVCYSDGKIERILRNGCHIILFPNGTQKEVSPDGKTTTVTFFNGDVKQVMADQRVIYYYADAQTTHTSYPDGLEILQFSNGQIEKHFPGGKKEITFPDQMIKNLNTDGTEESIFPDGTIITIKPDGNKIIAFDNGQQELHTPQFKRREYPDGTVKTVYSNGQQETKYASGRVRVKDKDGNVIMDTKM